MNINEHYCLIANISNTSHLNNATVSLSWKQARNNIETWQNLIMLLAEIIYTVVHCLQLAMCTDMVQQSCVENDRFEHRTSDIGNIGLQAAHRTSDCYTAPIPIRRLASLARPACSYCLTLDRVKNTCGAACVWSPCEISHLGCVRRQRMAWARRGR